MQSRIPYRTPVVLRIFIGRLHLVGGLQVFIYQRRECFPPDECRYLPEEMVDWIVGSPYGGQRIFPIAILRYQRPRADDLRISSSQRYPHAIKFVLLRLPQHFCFCPRTDPGRDILALLVFIEVTTPSCTRTSLRRTQAYNTEPSCVEGEISFLASKWIGTFVIFRVAVR